MFVRFVSTLPDPYTGRPQGIFQAANWVLDECDLPSYYRTVLQEHLIWFDEHLPSPSQLSQSRKRHAAPVALSWFKPSASECIARARELSWIVSDVAFPITMLTTPRPGVVVYEDEHQVAAVPFRTA